MLLLLKNKELLHDILDMVRDFLTIDMDCYIRAVVLFFLDFFHAHLPDFSSTCF